MKVGNYSTVAEDAIISEQLGNIVIGDNTHIKPGVVLRPETGNIIIGNNVIINHYTVIHGKGDVEIGDWCIIAPHCGIYAQNHSYASFDTPISQQENVGKGITLMGDNWLGAGSVILDNVTLGKGTVVGAGAVVTKSFPMAKVVVGNPARILKSRTDNWNFSTAERCSVSETPEHFYDYINNRINYAIKYITETDVVLDVGCGDGFVTSALKSGCKKIIGIDYSEEAVKELRDRYTIEGYHMPCSNMSLDSASFDKVICFEVLEHLLPLQLSKTISEIHRVLKQGGLLIGSTPIRTTTISEPSTYAHIYEYTETELRHILKDFNNVIIENNCFRASK